MTTGLWIADYTRVDEGDDITVTVAANLDSNELVSWDVDVGSVGTASRTYEYDSSTIDEASDTISTSPGDAGEYDVTMNITSSGGSGLIEYATDSGWIDEIGVENAINDWQAGNISDNLVFALLEAHRSTTGAVLKIDPISKYAFTSTSGPADTQSGSVLRWQSDITNQGSVDRTQSLKLRVDGQTVVETSAVQIASGSTESVDVSWTATDDFIGTDVPWTLEIGAASTSGTVDIAAAPTPELGLSINSVNQPSEGETLTVDIGVENRTDSSITDTIELRLNGALQDSTSVTVGAQAAENLSLSYSTTASDVGDLPFTVRADADPAVRTGTAVVTGVPGYSITGVDAPAETVAGDWVEFDVTVANNGTDDDGQDLVLDWGSTSVDNDRVTRISVPTGQSKTVSVPYLVKAGDSGTTVSWTVSTPSDSYSSNVDILEPGYDDPDLDITVQSVSTPVDEGYPVSVLANVVNQTDAAIQDTIDLEVLASTVDSADVDLDAGAEDSVILHWTNTLGEASTDNGARVAAQTDSAFATTLIELNEIARPQITTVTSPSEVAVDDQGSWQADIENVGSRGTGPRVSLTVGGEGPDTTSRVLLGGQETASVTLYTRPERVDVGESTPWNVAVGDDEQTGTLAVVNPELSIDALSTDAPVEPSDTALAVDADVVATGNRPVDQSVELWADGSLVDSATVSLNAGERTTVSLTWSGASDAAPGSYEIVVETDDDSVERTVDVLSPRQALEAGRVPATGYHVVVTGSDGTTRRPSVLDASPNPTLNDWPQIEVTVPRDETWQGDRWDEAALAVYRDGERLPIDTLERVEVSPSETILHGIGAYQLDRYVEYEVDDWATVHGAFETLLEEETDLAYEVDHPGGDPVTTHDLPSSTSFAEALASDPDVPVHATDTDTVELSKTTLGVEGEDGSGSFYVRDASEYSTPPDYSGGSAADIVEGNWSWQFEVDHEIPADHVGVRLRRQLVGARGEMLVMIDGQIVHGDVLGASNGSDEALQWVDGIGDPAYNIDGWSGDVSDPDDPPTLEPGETHELELRVSGFRTPSAFYTEGGDCNVDYVAVYDTRYEPDWPNTTDSNDALPGPQPYPSDATARIESEEPIGAVEGAVLETSWRDGDVSGSQALAVSNDRGDSWEETANTSSLDVSFASRGPTLEFRATLSRLDAGGTTTPTTGNATQALETATLEADIYDSPIVESKVFRGSIMDVFQNLADRADVLFEVQTIGDQLGVVVTYPGQRQANVDPDLIDYSVEKRPMDRVNALRISGRSETISREEFAAEDGGVALEHDSLKEGSETVRDPETGEVLERGATADYQISYDTGEVRRISDSEAMEAGQTYEIDYEWQPSATVRRSSDGDTRKRSRNIPELTSEAECREAGEYLLRELEDVPWTASVEISDAVGWRLVESIDPDELPGAGPYRVRSLEETPERVRVKLGQGLSPDEAVAELRSRLTSTEREV